MIPAKDGKKPKFFGSGGIVHQKIREKMYQILYSDEDFEVLNQISVDELEETRRDFSIFAIQNTALERPLQIAEKKILLYTFTGTKINRTLQLLFDLVGIKSVLDDSSSMFYIHVAKHEFISKWEVLLNISNTIDKAITDFLDEHPDSLILTKWGEYLPKKYQVELMKRNYYDIEATVAFLAKRMELVQNIKC